MCVFLGGDILQYNHFLCNGFIIDIDYGEFYIGTIMINGQYLVVVHTTLH